MVLQGLKGANSGGSIERWEDPEFRKCFESILAGDWQAHDPYLLEPRINARTFTHDQINKVS
jgi:hypothetical protein